MDQLLGKPPIRPNRTKGAKSVSFADQVETDAQGPPGQPSDENHSQPHSVPTPDISEASASVELTLAVSALNRGAHELQSVVNAVAHYNLDLAEMARLQVLDPDFQRMSQEAQTGLNFKKVKVDNQDLSVDIFPQRILSRSVPDSPTITPITTSRTARCRQSALTNTKIALSSSWPT